MQMNGEAIGHLPFIQSVGRTGTSHSCAGVGPFVACGAALSGMPACGLPGLPVCCLWAAWPVGLCTGKGWQRLLKAGKGKQAGKGC